MPYMMRTAGFALIEVLIVLTIVGILAGLGIGAWRNTEAPVIELRKNEWSCTKTEQRTHLQPMPAGKAMTVIPMTSTECVEYKRHDT